MKNGDYGTEAVAARCRRMYVAVLLWQQLRKGRLGAGGLGSEKNAD